MTDREIEISENKAELESNSTQYQEHEKKQKDISTLEELRIDYVSPVDDLFPNDYNPNRQDKKEFELLKKSIMGDGFTQPIVANRIKGTNKGIIVDGEHRWRAALELGLEAIPVVFVNMSRVQAKIATLRHNRARGTEDTNLLKDLFTDLEKLNSFDWIADSLALEPGEWDNLFGADFSLLDTESNESGDGERNAGEMNGDGERGISDTQDREESNGKDKGDRSMRSTGVENDSTDGEGENDANSVDMKGAIDYTESAKNSASNNNLDAKESNNLDGLENGVSEGDGDSDGTNTLTESTVSIDENIQRQQQTKQAYSKVDGGTGVSNKPIQDGNSYHINLLFTGEEAFLVSDILGTDPSKKIIELCLREKQGK